MSSLEGSWLYRNRCGVFCFRLRSGARDQRVSLGTRCALTAHLIASKINAAVASARARGRGMTGKNPTLAETLGKRHGRLQGGDDRRRPEGQDSRQQAPDALRLLRIRHRQRGLQGPRRGEPSIGTYILSEKERIGQAGLYKPFRDSDISRIFEPVGRKAAMGNDPDLYWCPLIALYSRKSRGTRAASAATTFPTSTSISIQTSSSKSSKQLPSSFRELNANPTGIMRSCCRPTTAEALRTRCRSGRRRWRASRWSACLRR